MPPRILTPMACQRCRIKRSRCDGQPRCARCSAAGAECQYRSNQKTSKDELRAEIRRLEKIIRNITSNPNESDNNEQTRQAPLPLNHAVVICSGGELPTPTASDSWSSPEYPSTSSTNHQPLSEPINFIHVSSWGLYRPPATAHTEPSTTALHLPPLPDNTFGSAPQLDTWTSTGWTKAYIRHMFDAVATWDFMALSMLHTEAFLRDYYQDCPGFCSSSLVHAILALAHLLVHGNNNTTQVAASKASPDQALYAEAHSALSSVKEPMSLPNIQALGIMAIYQLRCGQEQEAARLARQLHERIIQFCGLQHDDENICDDHLSRAKRSTYRGALFLVRIFSLSTGRALNIPVDNIGKTPITLGLILDDHETSQQNSRLRNSFATGSERNHSKLIVSKLFQLIEWAHSLDISARSKSTASLDTVKETYSNCQNWHQNFLSLLSSETSISPFIILVHVHYHFAVLCAFQRFIDMNTPDSDFNATDICSQAVQSILSLVQSYDDIFTLHRVPSILPYFVLAAAQFSVAVQERGLQLRPAYMLWREQLSNATQSIGKEQILITNIQEDLANTPYVQISMVDHARLLLQKMSSTLVVAISANQNLDKT